MISGEMPPAFDDSNDGYPWQATILPGGQEYIVKVLYTESEANGVLILVITSVISIIAVSGLLTAIGLSAWHTRKSTSPNLFVRTTVAPYFVFLMLSYFLQAIGSIMNARWIHKRAVEAGPFCTAQGVIKHISDVGVAVWALVIALHTFCLLFYRMSIPRWAMYATIVGAQGIVLLLTPLGTVIYGANKERGEFYGISGYWCWIAEEYGSARLTLDYLIVMLSAFIGFVLYMLVFLRMRGNIVVNGWYIRFRLARNDDWRGRDFAPGNTALSIAKQMLLYPIAYTILILPITTARFSEWTGHYVPFNITIFSDVIFLLSGLVNVVLFFTTRRLLPAESVLPSWRRFMPWNWFFNPVESSRAAEGSAEKSFACRAATQSIDVEKGWRSFNSTEQGIEEKGEAEFLYLPTADAHQSLRVKIDNHVDTILADVPPDYDSRETVGSLAVDIVAARSQTIRVPPAALVAGSNTFRG